MKLGILADIHEHDDELRRAIKVLQQHRADRIVVLGDVCELGERMEETVSLLRDVAAVGICGNHDGGFCFEPSEKIRQQYSTTVLDFMGSLQPRLEIDGCLFTHVEPWLDPNKIEDLWYFDGPPDSAEKLARSFAAVPNRVMFIGHFHRWLLGSKTGVLPWHGEGAINLEVSTQHLVIVNAVWSGHCALFDRRRTNSPHLESLEMAKAKVVSPFEGLWRIVSMSQWDQAFVDEEETGYFEFDERGRG